MRKCTFLFLLILFIVTSCSSGNTVVEEPVTDGEAAIFARKLETNMNDRKGKFMDESIKWEVFYKRMNTGSDGQPKMQVSKKDLRTVINDLRLGERTAENLSNETTFNILRSYKENGRQHVLFRIYASDGINYFDFELTKVKGKVGISDIFIYLTAENISETVRELLLQIDAATKKVSSSDRGRVEKINEVKRLYKAGRYKEVVTIIDNLPPAWKKVKVFMIMKVMSASRYDVEASEKAWAEFKASFPKEYGKMNLMLLDGYITQKNWRAALTSLNNLDKQLGTDPYLDLQRSTMYYQLEQMDSAIFCLERLVSKEPRFEDGYSELIYTYLLAGDESKARDLFKQAKESNLLKSKTIQLLEENYPEITK